MIRIANIVGNKQPVLPYGIAGQFLRSVDRIKYSPSDIAFRRLKGHNRHKEERPTKLPCLIGPDISPEDPLY